MKNWFSLIFFLLVSMGVNSQNLSPSDKYADTLTTHLFRNLQKLRKKGFLFGHQDDLAYGVKWKYIPGKSDVKDVTGDYPALHGWDLSHIELDEKVNIDSVPFENIRRYIVETYERGGLNTISWHGINPLTGKTAWDNAPGTIAAILPGGSKHELYKTDLDKIAGFLASLKDKKGMPIPILYRPFHELTGNWFWWGTASSNSADFKAIFRFTIHYLREVKKLHNLLIVYNTSDSFNTAESFLERYPGDDVVDILSFDAYETPNAINDVKFGNDLNRHLSIIEQLAKEKNKIPAIAEMGFNQIPEKNWWTKTLVKAINGHSPAFVLFWRNAGYKPINKSTEYYVPYPGQASEANFIQFYHLPTTLFEKDAAKAKLYQ